MIEDILVDDDALVDALVKIGNHKEVTKMCEPNIMESLPLKEWQVKRTLKAIELFMKEWDNATRRE